VLEVMIITVFVIWVIESFRHPEHSEGSHGILPRQHLMKLWRVRMTREWWLAMGLLLLAATVAIFVAPNHWAALGIWRAYFLEPILLFIVAVHVLKNKRDVQNLFAAFAISGLFISIVAIFQFVTGIGIPTPWDVERRVASIFPYPNAVGLYLGPIIVIGFSVILNHFVILRRPERSTKDLLGFFASLRMTPRIWFWIAAVLLGFIAIILAQSEAAVAAVLITSFVLFLLDKRTRRFAAAAAVIAVIVVAAVAPLRTFLWQKASLQDFSGTVRRAMWAETVEMLKDRPLLGAGLSGYKAAVAPYHKHPEWEIFQYPHNIILNIWSELGVLGLIAFLYLAWQVFSVILSEAKDLKKDSSPPTSAKLWRVRMTSLAAFAALLEITLHGLVDVPYFKNDLAAMTWLLLAVLVVSRSVIASPGSSERAKQSL
jgi:O-antigen ligase